MGWRPIEEAPKDGSHIAALASYRWLKYKPGAPRWAQKLGGRWQTFNGYGWENAEPPSHWLPHPPHPASEE